MDGRSRAVEFMDKNNGRKAAGHAHRRSADEFMDKGWAYPASPRPWRTFLVMAYLDHAATTPVFPEALAEFVKVAAAEANPSSLHGSGRRARRVLEQAREKVATCLDAHPTEVVFTSGGTEADNLAIKGIYWARRKTEPGRKVIIAPATEHHAVLDTVNWLALHEGARAEWLPVDRAGRVSTTDLAKLLDRLGDTVALVTAMWANNEIGTIAPVAELAAVARARDVPFHTDAVQAVGAIPVRFDESGVSALSLTGHKFGAPVGTGALLLGRGVGCEPVLHGGGQERLVRSGTLNAAGAASLAVAVELAVAHQAEQAARLRVLRDELIAKVRREVPEAILNGDVGPGRLPGNAHFTFPGCEGDALLMLLDAQGVECSTGSACTAGVPEPSHVLLATGVDPAWARESLRFSLGHTSTEADVDALVAVIGGAVARARRASATRRR